MVPRALEAWEQLKARGIAVKVFNVACPLDLDMEKVEEGANTGLIVAYEDHNRNSGLGVSLSMSLCSLAKPVKLVRMGVHRYGESGTPDAIMARMGLAPADVVKVIEATLASLASKME